MKKRTDKQSNQVDSSLLKYLTVFASLLPIFIMGYQTISSLGENRALLFLLLSVLLTALLGIFSQTFAISIRKFTRRPRVFISYSHEDSKVANDISIALRKNGAFVWNPEEQLHPGDDWQVKITNAIKDSDVFIPIITKNAQDSDFLKQEISYASLNNARIIPVLAKKTRIPDSLSNLSYIRIDKQPHKAIIEEIIEATT